MNTLSFKCYFVSLAALFSKRVIYGYKCDLENLYDDIQQARRYAAIEDNIQECSIFGDIIDEMNKFKYRINNTYTDICRDC